MKKLNDYKNDCDNTRDYYRAANDYYRAARDNSDLDDLAILDAARAAYVTGAAHDKAIAAYESELDKVGK